MNQPHNGQEKQTVTKGHSSVLQQSHARLTTRTCMLQIPQYREQRPTFKVQGPSRIHRLQGFLCHHGTPQRATLALSRIRSMEVSQQRILR